MRIIIVGAVAAGTAAALEARHAMPDAQVVVYDRDAHVSYIPCGLPFYIGGAVADIAALQPRSPAWFSSQHRIDVRIRHEVTSVDPVARTILVTDLATGASSTDHYDALVLAAGATPLRPGLPGATAEGVFTLRSPADAMAIRSRIEAGQVSGAVVVGGGFIGLEVAEQLAHRGITVTVVERLGQVMPPLDEDMADLVAGVMAEHGVGLRLRSAVTDVVGTPVSGVALDSGETIEAQLVILAVGIRPNVDLARQAGVALGASGAIAVDSGMATSVPGIWAVGDVAESYSAITGEPAWRPLGSTAIKMGRVAADAISGSEAAHRGVLGTGIFAVFGTAVAQTGLTERAAAEAGFEVVVVREVLPDRPEYLGGRPMTIKAIADRATGRLLGAQIVGPQGVDKRIDVLATAITFGARAADLAHLDLAYSPPFATTKDPLHHIGIALQEALRAAT